MISFIQDPRALEFDCFSGRRVPTDATLNADFRRLVQLALSGLRVTRDNLDIEAQHQAVTSIDCALQALDASLPLAHRLADNSRIPPSVELTPVQAVLLSVSDFLRQAFGGGVSIHTCVAQTTPHLQCSPIILENVLLKLAIAELSAVPNASLVTFECRGTPPSNSTGSEDIAKMVSIDITCRRTREMDVFPRPPLDRLLCTPLRHGENGSELGRIQDLAEALGGYADLEIADCGDRTIRMLLPG